MKYIYILFSVFTLICRNQKCTSADKHSFAASFSANSEPISGYYSLDLGSDTITNITLSDKWTSGEGNIQITAGGIGLNKLVVQYDLQEGSVVANEVLINSLGNESNTSKIRRGTHDEDKMLASQLTVKAESSWSLLNSSRTVVGEFKFDKTVIQCSGFSAWTNGTGYTALTGGIGQRHLKLVSIVPAEEIGFSSYTCEFSSDSTGRFHRRKREIQEGVTSKQLYSVHQIYGSVYENGFVSWQFNQEIISFGGGAVWINGTGIFEVVAGGVGHDILEFRTGVQENTFGIYSFNITLRV